MPFYLRTWLLLCALAIELVSCAMLPGNRDTFSIAQNPRSIINRPLSTEQRAVPEGLDLKQRDGISLKDDKLWHCRNHSSNHR